MTQGIRGQCGIVFHQQIYVNHFQLTCNTSVVVGLTRYICYTCFTPEVRSLCSYPTNQLVSTIAPDHQACMLQFHLTSSLVFISCILSAFMSVTVLTYQHPCILYLHLNISHVCKNCRPVLYSNTQKAVKMVK